MSENGEGRTIILKEEEEGMQEILDQRIYTRQSSNFMNPDEELLSWLHYPIDDDMFHHLPSPLTATPALPSPADFFSPPSSFPLSTSPSSLFSSSSLASSSLAVKHLPQLDNNVFTVAKDFDQRGAIDDWILHKENLGNENFQGEQTTAFKSKGVLIGHGGSVSLKNDYEACHPENRGDRRAEMWANRILDYKQGLAKDTRNLAYLKHTVKEERGAQVTAPKSVPHPLHSPLESAILLDEEDHTDMMLTDTPRDEEERGMQRRAEAQEEELLQFGQASNEVYWLENNMDMRLDTKEAAPLIGRFQTLSNVDAALAFGADRAVKEGVPMIGRLQTLSNADAALALGAGRAAGIIKPPGMEAFSKVRTSLQPTQIVAVGSPAVSSSFSLSNVRTCLQPTQHVLSGSSAFSSSLRTSESLSGENLFGPAFSNRMPTTLRPVGSSDSTPVSQLSYQTEEAKLHDRAHLHVPKPSAGLCDMVFQQNSFNFQEKIRTTKSNVTRTFCLEPSSTVDLTSPQGVVTPTDEGKNLLIRDETMVGIRSGTAASGLDTTDVQKFSSVSFLSQENTTGTCSGGSQTSESLKEAASELKRKLEDSECLSEEADEDSVVSSQARTTSSKRPRANEVHNLSERRRRNRINDKMNALRELIPNASKSNKAALLDEAIDYLKNLQLQLQVMSLRTGGSLLPMVLPPSMPHMPIPEYKPHGSIGLNLSGGSTLANAIPTMGIGTNKACAAPARPSGLISSVSGSLISSDLRPLQPLAASLSFSQSQGLSAHSHIQASSQLQ